MKIEGRMTCKWCRRELLVAAKTLVLLCTRCDFDANVPEQTQLEEQK